MQHYLVSPAPRKLVKRLHSQPHVSPFRKITVNAGACNPPEGIIDGVTASIYTGKKLVNGAHGC